MKPLLVQVDGRMALLADVRVDYRREGRDALGWFALQMAPIAFLSYADRAVVMGCDDYSFRADLPMSLTLEQAARLLT